MKQELKDHLRLRLKIEKELSFFVSSEHQLEIAIALCAFTKELQTRFSSTGMPLSSTYVPVPRESSYGLLPAISVLLLEGAVFLRPIHYDTSSRVRFHLSHVEDNATVGVFYVQYLTRSYWVRVDYAKREVSQQGALPADSELLQPFLEACAFFFDDTSSRVGVLFVLGTPHEAEASDAHFLTA